jgi:hypothetical protein
VARVLVPELRREAEPPEPVHEVVGQQKQVEVGLVSEEVASRDAAEGIIPCELFDEQLDAGPVVVEAPEMERLERQLRDEHLVVVLAEFEERQLIGRFLGLGPADHHKPIWRWPAGRLVPELGDLDPAAGAHRAPGR